MPTVRSSSSLFPLGTYSVVGRSLANSGNGGQTNVELTAGGTTTTDATVTFRGAGSVVVTVVAADGVTPVPSAQVRLRATGAAPGASPGPMASELNGFTNASGAVTFQNVPIGAIVASGEVGGARGHQQRRSVDARPGRWHDRSPWPIRDHRRPPAPAERHDASRTSDRHAALSATVDATNRRRASYDEPERHL